MLRRVAKGCKGTADDHKLSSESGGALRGARHPGHVRARLPHSQPAVVVLEALEHAELVGVGGGPRLASERGGERLSLHNLVTVHVA